MKQPPDHAASGATTKANKRVQGSGGNHSVTLSEFTAARRSRIMTWKPLTEEELHQILNSAWQRMSLPQRRLWEAIRIEPQKWASHPYGDLGGGFWVVALPGETVVWFNDIEDGFNRSNYTTHGSIGAYWCNQDQLEWTIQSILDSIETGATTGLQAGPPQPLSP